jgi:hypothetical protein
MKSFATVLLSFIGTIAGLFFLLCSVCAFGGGLDRRSSGQLLGWAAIFLALTVGTVLAVAKLNGPE